VILFRVFIVCVLFVAEHTQMVSSETAARLEAEARVDHLAVS
jgi:hypothetical protein